MINEITSLRVMVAKFDGAFVVDICCEAAGATGNFVITLAVQVAFQDLVDDFLRTLGIVSTHPFSTGNPKLSRYGRTGTYVIETVLFLEVAVSEVVAVAGVFDCIGGREHVSLDTGLKKNMVDKRKEVE